MILTQVSCSSQWRFPACLDGVLDVPRLHSRSPLVVGRAWSVNLSGSLTPFWGPTWSTLLRKRCSVGFRTDNEDKTTAGEAEVPTYAFQSRVSFASEDTPYAKSNILMDRTHTSLDLCGLDIGKAWSTSKVHIHKALFASVCPRPWKDVWAVWMRKLLLAFGKQRLKNKTKSKVGCSSLILVLGKESAF